MKTYIGTKIIKAEPMDEHTFRSDGGKMVIDAARPNREGYKIVYPDGYTSWSPKHVFETAYREITEGEKDLMFLPPEATQPDTVDETDGYCESPT